MKKTTILVTGSTGYIGSALISGIFSKFNNNSVHIKAFVRKSSPKSVLKGFPVEWIEGDMNDPQSLLKATKDIDVVFHTAALVSYQRLDRRKLFRINVEGTRHLIDAALENKVKRVVFTSSVAAIGINENGQPADEATDFLPWQHHIGYMVSKYLSELEIYRGIAEGLDAIILNPGVVIGDYPGLENKSKASKKLLKDIYNGKMPYYPLGGVGFVDIVDVVQAHINAWLEGECGERFNVVSENVTYKSLYDRIAAIQGSRRSSVFPLSNLFGIVIGLVAELGGVVFQRTSPIAMDNVYLSRKNLFYSNKKSVEKLSVSYTPLNESLVRILKQ